MPDELLRTFDHWHLGDAAGSGEFEAVIDRIEVLAEEAMPPDLGDETQLWEAAAKFEELLDLTSRALGIVPDASDSGVYRVMLAVVAYRGVIALDRLYDVIAGLHHGPSDLDPATEAAARSLSVAQALVERYRGSQLANGIVH